MQIYTTDQTRTRLEQLTVLAGTDASMSGVIKRLVDAEWERCNLVSITTLPHPDGAEPVTVVKVSGTYTLPAEKPAEVTEAQK
jgi:hypothetical protein